jgi:pimeloyl-ACP methyl ester carboxylesterase
MSQNGIIYLIGGLGVDERVFTTMHFKDHEKRVVKWIEPMPGETLPDYCKGLLPQIDTPEPIIAGVSFGGITANEIAKLIPVKQVILISSVRSADEMPFFMRLAGMLNLHKIVPLTWARKANRLLRWAFWVQDPEHRKLLETIAGETSPTFLKWSINEVVKWRGAEGKNVFQIHGDKDKTFPVSKLKHPDIVLKGTGHFMVVQRANEVAKIIEDVVSRLDK